MIIIRCSQIDCNAFYYEEAFQRIVLSVIAVINRGAYVRAKLKSNCCKSYHGKKTEIEIYSNFFYLVG